MWIRDYRRSALPAFIAAVLLLAGFGCKPILDAGVKNAQRQAEETTSFWLPEDPILDFWHGPDLVGSITLDVHSKPGTTISVELFGPGILSKAYQSMDADKDGRVHFAWHTNRIGHYRYDGSIVFNRSLVHSFNDEFDTDRNP